jgi:hypothetical protein
MADLIAGPDHALTPPEAFVLGGAFLVHDLGNGLAAYPEPESELFGSPEYLDALAAGLRRAGITPKALDPKSVPRPIARAALEDTLRLLHARAGALLPTREWKDKEGQSYRLIEDDDVRDHFAEGIGLIAHSHWWNAAELASRIKPEVIAPAAWMPADWTVDAVRVGCLLRVSDAAHLDSRRAPPFLRALRAPDGVSDSHWQFQAKLSRPALRGDRLLYTSSSFPRTESAAWWLCFDALQLLDRELHAVDVLLSERPSSSSRPRFAARGVVGVADPIQLADHVRTKDWIPVDAKVHVSDVPALIRALGGEALYGDNPLVPLRELIQNAADAVRARRVLQPGLEGAVTIRHGKTGDQEWVEVSDNGIGMSQDTLTHHLLDFGKSFWNSQASRNEFPGLASSSFNPTGRFGIGFFSVFMWGDAARIISRKFGDAHEATRVLEFSAGVASRPVLRPAEPAERLPAGGTTVRVWLREPVTLTAPSNMDPVLESVFATRGRGRGLSWTKACLITAPALDVDLWFAQGDDVPKRISQANDWRTVSAADLLGRLNLERTGGLEVLLDDVVARNGDIVGRAAIASILAPCVVTAGGLRASTVSGICGLLIGETSVAARDQATPLCSPSALQAWAQRQVLILNTRVGRDAQWNFADALARFGADVTNLAAGKYKDRYLSIKEMAALFHTSEHVLLVDRPIPDEWVDEFPDPVVVIEERSRHHHPFGKVRGSLARQVAAALASSWGASLTAVEEVSELEVSVSFDVPDQQSFDVNCSKIVRPDPP